MVMRTSSAQENDRTEPAPVESAAMRMTAVMAAVRGMTVRPSAAVTAAGEPAAKSAAGESAGAAA